MASEETPKESNVSNIAKAMVEINEVIKVNKLNARDVAHIATELNLNANLALVFANIYSNGMESGLNGKEKEEVLKGKVPVKNVRTK